MADSHTERLAAIIAELPEDKRQALLEYAEFLRERHGRPPVTPELLDIPRPDQESVIKAIQRLRATYPMLDPAQLLHEATALMTQHVTQGREAETVIDEIEALFRAHYERLTRNDK
ncbi:MAG: hypothetical protein A3B81_02990 [Candidatus Muproteobacteria bacterium RIFCSPHIGHO2_02_FULL_65_16]|uniref:Crp/Fnr family transcriptional regulator n=1 Tax=Candidatus Muproteobacteria bacterium RIFCSPHIGHO2_02_FULL_65_16 TaxID=1817766 RepID=A0A1F6TZZ1_9PROT|nr:MAG: hypothetical protein A3B81_02990 [Candidatus Muproteobacteria bacterium RIFCSPHIGHO2_02_FULL_65_16]